MINNKTYYTIILIIEYKHKSIYDKVKLSNIISLTQF